MLLIICVPKDDDVRKTYRKSPIGSVHRFAKYVLSSPQRREEFLKVEAERQPDLKRKLYPKRDVRTRWNSTYDSICRALRLEKTIIAFSGKHSGGSGGKCPKMTKDTFRALETVQVALEVFLGLTLQFSKAEGFSHKIIVELDNAVQALAKLRATAPPARKPSFDAAIDKLEKYLKPLLKNNWVCAAFALDPKHKELGLAALFNKETGYDMPERKEEVVEWIRNRAGQYVGLDSDEDPEVVFVSVPEESNNRFSCFNNTPCSSLDSQEPNDSWSEYNTAIGTGQGRTSLKRGEHILAYWKRQSDRNVRMRPLAKVAREVLSLSASSTHVERLFSQSGHTLGIRRGALHADMLLRQTSLKMWDSIGHFNVKEMEAFL